MARSLLLLFYLYSLFEQICVNSLHSFLLAHGSNIVDRIWFLRQLFLTFFVKIHVNHAWLLTKLNMTIPGHCNLSYTKTKSVYLVAEIGKLVGCHRLPGLPL